MIGAAVDVGSTSVHLLVATVEGERIEPLADESAFLGLGTAVEAGALLGDDRARDLVQALRGYRDRARDLGAPDVVVVATQPLRRAADAASVVRLVERELGIALHVLSHEEEGLLTLLGATGGRAVSDELVVADVGGGSTEIVVAMPGRPPTTVGLGVGATRLTARFVRRDPAGREEIEAMIGAARRALDGAPAAVPGDLVAVGGTAQNLLRVTPGAEPDSELGRERLFAALEVAGGEPSDSLALRLGLRPERVRLLPAGVAILLGLLDRYEVERIRVSQGGIREGTLLAESRAGAGWRDRLGDLVAGSPSVVAPGGAPTVTG